MSDIALNFVKARIIDEDEDEDDDEGALTPAKRQKRGGPSAMPKNAAFMRGCAVRSDIRYVVLRSQILLAAQPFVNLLAALPEHIRNVPHNIVVLRSGASILVDDLNQLKRLVEDLRA